jgi:hypothetical protein
MSKLLVPRIVKLPYGVKGRAEIKRRFPESGPYPYIPFEVRYLDRAGTNWSVPALQREAAELVAAEIDRARIHGGDPDFKRMEDWKSIAFLEGGLCPERLQSTLTSYREARDITDFSERLGHEWCRKKRQGVFLTH